MRVARSERSEGRDPLARTPRPSLRRPFLPLLLILLASVNFFDRGVDGIEEWFVLLGVFLGVNRL
jgi:hypothetical protein